MGIYDRDYYREPAGSSVGSMRMWSVTTWLIVINIVVYLVGIVYHPFYYQIVSPRDGHAIVMPPVEFWGHFSVLLGIQNFQIWRFLTFQFLHASFSHILFNMFALYFFGPLVEQALGRERYLGFYL